MNVLALASYPIEAAATRYRLSQFVAPLKERGIHLTIRPFLDSQTLSLLYKRSEWPHTAAGLLRSTFRRIGDIWRARAFDALLVQREAMLFGPPVIEWLTTKVGQCPMVLDLDDATYIPYTSPTYGDHRLVRTLKWFSKTDDLIRWSKVVTCGNRAIAEYVTSKGGSARIIPTVVNTDVFRPATKRRSREAPVLGWIGTNSTYPFLESIYPALQQLARTHRFRLKVIGSGRDTISIPGVEVENLTWSLEREVEDFQSFDIGLYPLLEGDWTAGKSGFKSVQYMAVGIPYVVTPIGACAEIGEPNVTHFSATTQTDWRETLARLVSDEDLRRRMGVAGRRHALQHYNVPMQADKLALALHDAAFP